MSNETEIVKPENNGQMNHSIDRNLRANEVHAQVQIMQSVMKKVMKNKVHYGLIPGCGEKPTLLKPGAEKILMTFRIGTRMFVEDLSTEQEARYRVKCEGYHIGTGQILGEGMGECSSFEKKYRWEKAICKEQYQDFPDDRKRIKFDSYKGRVTKTQQIMKEKADIANTILKMADKRAMVAMTLKVTAASDIFTQDVEDMVAEPVNNQPSERPAVVKTITDKMIEEENDITALSSMFNDLPKDSVLGNKILLKIQELREKTDNQGVTS